MERVKLFEPGPGEGLDALEKEYEKWHKDYYENEEFCIRVIAREIRIWEDKVVIAVFYEKMPRNLAVLEKRDRATSK